MSPPSERPLSAPKPASMAMRVGESALSVPWEAARLRRRPIAPSMERRPPMFVCRCTQAPTALHATVAARAA